MTLVPRVRLWSSTRRDEGFTLLEMMVVLVIAGVLMAIAVGGMRSFLTTSRESGTATDIRSVLRTASEQSLSEGRTYCVLFSSTQYTVYKSSCTTGTVVRGPFKVQDPSVTVQALNFLPPSTAVPGQTTSCPTPNACAYFYPRGTALAGSLQVTRSGGRTYTISVEGLTSRVALS